MKTKIVEGTTPKGLYLKAMVGRFDIDEWTRRSIVADQAEGRVRSLLRQEGWGLRHFFILDLSKLGRGGIFHMDPAPAAYDVKKAFPDGF